MLTSAEADRLTTAALDAAQELGFAAAAAVVDAGGHLMSFRRADGAGFLCAIAAPRKGWTAAAAGLSTEQWNAMAADPSLTPMVQGTGLLAVGGGVPLFDGGTLVGGLGVSGSSPADDQSAADGAMRRWRPAST